MASPSQQSFFAFAISFLVLIIIATVVVAERKKRARSFPETPAQQTGVGIVPSIPGSQTPLANESTESKQESLIFYTNEGFSPKILRVKKATIVTFQNKISDMMWPASAVHPSHKVYPTIGGCLGSTFDACAEIPENESWQFKFDIAGAWGYHNHLNSIDTGTVIVE